MDLIAWLRPTPRPLIVTAPGGRAVRLAAERLTRLRGWEQASAPAGADLLVVCGTPDAPLAAAVERVWAQLPSPRARVDVAQVHRVAGELDRARARLTDPAYQQADSAGRAPTPPTTGSHPAHPAGDDHGPPAHDMSGGHDMPMMHGGEVAGLPMADRAPDRDGLTLDVLHLTLGPVLADWPAGLAVQVTLQGDVVQSARVTVAGDPGSPWDGPPVADALDGLARLLSVCGATTAARTARRLRDDMLAGAVDDDDLRRFARRLRRSRTLRWATDGVGPLDDTHGDLAGDATRRWMRWLDTAEGRAPGRDRAEGTRAALAALPGLLEGCELAAARVLVASLDPDPDLLVAGALR